MKGEATNSNLAFKTQATQQTRRKLMMMMMVKIRTGTGQDPLMQAKKLF
jgi:hypothetical protein